MLIRTVVSPLLGTNCYVVAEGGWCVVVDPGALVLDQVRAVVTAGGWTPAAVLVTHGHVDHTWGAGPLAEALDVAVHVHEADRYRLDDPFGTLGPLGAQLEVMAQQAGERWQPPRRVRTFGTASDPGSTVHLDLPGGPDLRAVHAPGHTEGSTVFLLDGAPEPGSTLPDPAGAPDDDLATSATTASTTTASTTATSTTATSTTALTGDVLFAGTIGRTDLPGGDHPAMLATLGRLAALPATTLLLPGHGPRSRLSTELTVNPYLRTPR